ncbi:hypothetical protein AT269_22225 [Bacillus cereus]|nr:hypothetical protein AT269_22225 [Bacillus cereus]KXY41886.1 hypothetical protein AT257_08645 [Bacillus cereus]
MLIKILVRASLIIELKSSVSTFRKVVEIVDEK